MKWEVTAIVVNDNFAPAAKAHEVNKMANEGWEPYAIDGNTHWFKRCETKLIGATLESFAPAKNKGKK